MSGPLWSEHLPRWDPVETEGTSLARIQDPPPPCAEPGPEVGLHAVLERVLIPQNGGTRNMVYKKHREIQYSYVSKIDLKIQ